MQKRTYLPITIRADGPKLFAFINAAIAKAYSTGYADGKKGNKEVPPKLSEVTFRKINDPPKQPPA